MPALTISQLVGNDVLPCELMYQGRSVTATYRPAMLPATAFSLRARGNAATTEEDAAALLDECAHIICQTLASWEFYEDGTAPGKRGALIPIEYSRVRQFSAELLASFAFSLVAAPTLKKTKSTNLSRDSRRTASSRTRKSSDSSASRKSRTGSAN